MQLSDLHIRSSWIAGHGDVIQVGARRANGKKLKPRKKRGLPLSDAVRAEQAFKSAMARERRRVGLR